MPVQENPQHNPQWNVYLGGETSSSLLDQFLSSLSWLFSAPPWWSVVWLWWSSAPPWSSSAPSWWVPLPSAPLWWSAVRLWWSSAPPWSSAVPTALLWWWSFVWLWWSSAPPWWFSVPPTLPDLSWFPAPSWSSALPASPQSPVSPWSWSTVSHPVPPLLHHPPGFNAVGSIWKPLYRFYHESSPWPSGQLPPEAALLLIDSHRHCLLHHPGLHFP